MAEFSYKWVRIGVYRVDSYGEIALRHIHDGGKRGNGEKNESSGGQHHVPGVMNDRHGEEDAGEHPAAKGRPVEQLRHSYFNKIDMTWNDNI